MLRYILRRVLFMIPTVFGVILLTFVLFNVAGGSAAEMALGAGKNTPPELLEDFDESRGYNKPLFFGNWVSTRVFDRTRFNRNASVFASVPGVEYHAEAEGRAGHLFLGENDPVTIPLAFSARADTRYEWRIRCRGGESPFKVKIDGLPEGTVEASRQGGFFKADWVSIPFRTGTNTSEIVCSIQAPAGGVELYEMWLARGVENPFDSQLIHYLNQLAHGDFGRSHHQNEEVLSILKSRVKPTLMLTIPILSCGVVLAVGLSLICAFYHNTLTDRTLMIVSIALMSVNYMIWIVVAQFVLGYKLGWFPIWGFESWHYLALPVLIALFHGLGADLRFYRTVMLDEAYKDYVRAAFAKGVGKRGVLFRHILPNAMIPIVTNVIISIPFLYTGSILLERFFGIPGLGDISLVAVTTSDIDVIRAVVLLGALLFVFFNLVMDICYTLVDPRMRLK